VQALRHGLLLVHIGHHCTNTTTEPTKNLIRSSKALSLRASNLLLFQRWVAASSRMMTPSWEANSYKKKRNEAKRTGAPHNVRHSDRFVRVGLRQILEECGVVGLGHCHTRIVVRFGAHSGGC
jgi:hypothetical protein